MKNHRHFGVAGITIRIESDLPITGNTFHPKVLPFEVDRPGADIVTINHHFHPPGDSDSLGAVVHTEPPFTIYRRDDSWVYRVVEKYDSASEKTVFFNQDYTSAEVFNVSSAPFLGGNLESLTMLRNDQVMLAHTMSHRDACYFHSSSASIDGRGFLFMGHSEVGKSTIARMLSEKTEVICDERVVVRRWPDGLWIHGSWSHGWVPIVSPNKAPLKAICFLKQAPENRVEAIEDKGAAFRRLVGCLLKPFQTKEWWERSASLLDSIIDQVPCYELQFDLSGRVFDVLKDLSRSV